MSNHLAKRTDTTPAERCGQDDAASRLKHALMADALDRLCGGAGDGPAVRGTPRVIVALANHGRSPGWDRAKVLQRQMFTAAGGNGLGACLSIRRISLCTEGRVRFCLAHEQDLSPLEN